MNSQAKIQQLYNALNECRQFIIDNMDALPESKEVRFNALKALNEFDEENKREPAKTPVETRTIVLKNHARELMGKCEHLIQDSKDHEKTAGDCTEKQFHAEALGTFQKMLLETAASCGASLQFVAMK